MKKVLSRQDVTVGISADGRTEILSGISKGDTVMTESNSEEIYNGVYVFRKIPLKNRTNIIEVSSGDQFDRAEIEYGK